VHYPIFLDLTDRKVLVVGGGKVALRKIRGLIEAGANVTAVAPRFESELAAMPIRRIRRKYRAPDLAGVSLVFAATDQRDVNRRIGAAAKRRGILANVADAPAECDFLVPARLAKGSIQIAISTGGTAPRIASEMRKKLEQIL
jgi:siroheme synthase-like protein